MSMNTVLFSSVLCGALGAAVGLSQNSIPSQAPSVKAGALKSATRQQLANVIAEIRRADYEANQAQMARGYNELERFLADKELASRVRYWRGFAQWRRAINGFNDNVSDKEIDADLKLAMSEFEQALAADPAFFDARVGFLSAQGYWGYLHRKEKEVVEGFRVNVLPKLKEAAVAGAEHPRMLWVLGPTYFASGEKNGGETKAIAAYTKGLELIRKSVGVSSDPIEPSWGEPELLMNLAWSMNNKVEPDPEKAWQYAQEALAMAPNWHYLRDILIPQIATKRAK